MDPIARMYQSRDEQGREERRQHKKPPQRFRSSELADCKRRIWYRLMGYVPAPKYGFSQDWSDDGDIHHDLVRQQLLAHGIPLLGITQHADGTTSEDDYQVGSFEYEGHQIGISARQDCWCYYDNKVGWVLTEIKSVGHWIYKYMQDAYEAGGPDGLLVYIQDHYAKYIYQVQANMAMARLFVPGIPFPEGQPVTLDKAYLIIKDRSNCHMGFHSDKWGVCGGPLVDFDQETMDKILRRLALVKGKLDDGKAPLAEFTASSRDCSYCDFRYACHDATKRRQQGLEPAVLYPDAAVQIGTEYHEG